jgi:hypothetical protein
VFERRRPAIKAVLDSSDVGFETASKDVEEGNFIILVLHDWYRRNK